MQKVLFDKRKQAVALQLRGAMAKVRDTSQAGGQAESGTNAQTEEAGIVTQVRHGQAFTKA